MIIKFVIINENMLCYVDPRNKYSAQILRPLFTRGAVCGWPLCNSYPLPIDGNGVRPATKKDFVDFGIESKGYENDKLIKYEIAEG